MAAAAVKKKKNTQRNRKSRLGKGRSNQVKKKKNPQNRRGTTKSGQVTRCTTKKLAKKGGSKQKARQLTKAAQGVMSSCVEGLCQVVSSEAERLRKENNEPTITHPVLLSALEQCLAKKEVRSSLTPANTKARGKKQTSEPSGVSRQIPAKQQKQSATPASRKLS